MIQRACDSGVAGLLITGTSERESQAALEICQQYPDYCWSTAGVHPHDAAQVSASYIDILRQLASQPGVKAIGECGLDFNRNFSPAEAQIAVFKQQIALASELELPLFLHERDAWDSQMEILSGVNNLRGVAHCFTGTTEQMQGYLSLGLYIGVTGWLCDPKRGESLREALVHLPLDKLLIETDAPYLTPKTLPGKIRRNEPCYLPHIAETIAEIKQVSVATIAEVSSANAARLFGLKLR
ncbi:3'-5' ssDNA/RNA exonuclease TatD [Planctobacterium marinum]|uniref:3'-5' ssDNA/RNA exonuclease TatD n=1 Tax=Planctobacterium marinum TaxID=1631968 RepID=A0AA48HTS3_9ALTE|nr:3'-5' ssDNA/RNA exonuclease TatD [Planctobacterium marinum]